MRHLPQLLALAVLVAVTVMVWPRGEFGARPAAAPGRSAAPAAPGVPPGTRFLSHDWVESPVAPPAPDRLPTSPTRSAPLASGTIECPTCGATPCRSCQIYALIMRTL
ncbi:hypothetical protein BH23VER1_BH23VER1_05250 [soil metagenome]